MGTIGSTSHPSLTGADLGSAQRVRPELMLLAAILVLAAGLRFTAIGSKSFWADEAYSAFVAAHTPRDIVTLTAQDDAHPPLYYLLLSLWRHVAGADDAGLRSLGALASVLTVGGAWWVARQLGGSWVGLVTAFLTAVAPFQVLAAQEARMYALLGLLAIASWAALLAAIGSRRIAWFFYVAATALALYTHYFAFLIIFGQAIFVVSTARRSVRTWVFSQGAIFVLFLPWLGRFLATATAGRGWPFLRLPLEATTVTSLLGLLSFGGHVFGFAGWFGGGATPLPVQLAILAPFVALAGLGLVGVWHQRRALWFVIGALLAPLAATIAFSLRTNVIYPRYFSFLHVPFAVLLAFGMVHITSYFVPTYRRVALLALGLAFLLASAPVLRDLYFNPTFQVFDWRGAATWLTAEAGPNDVIVVTPEFGRIPFLRYFRGPQLIVGMNPTELNDPKTTEVQGAALNARTRALFQSYAASHDVLWIVTDIGLPPTAFARLVGLLDGIYDRQGAVVFSAIRVYKARRHPLGGVRPGTRRGTVEAFSIAPSRRDLPALPSLRRSPACLTSSGRPGS